MDNDGPFTANIWSHANHRPSPLALSLSLHPPPFMAKGTRSEQIVTV